jgi:hypothetical protein
MGASERGRVSGIPIGKDIEMAGKRKPKSEGKDQVLNKS